MTIEIIEAILTIRSTPSICLKVKAKDYYSKIDSPGNYIGLAFEVVFRLGLLARAIGYA